MFHFPTDGALMALQGRSAAAERPGGGLAAAAVAGDRRVSEPRVQFFSFAPNARAPSMTSPRNFISTISTFSRIRISSPVEILCISK